MSRDVILRDVRAQSIEPAPLPRIPPSGVEGSAQLFSRFTTVLEQVGGAWTQRDQGTGLAEVVRLRYPTCERVVFAADGVSGSTVTITADTDASDLVGVDLAIIRGRIGVAENGAVWVDEEQLPHRALPFVAEHCVLLLATDDLVADMHAAYTALEGRNTGYGVFISGPSKTADIEQALVIGAQGPRSLLIVFDPAA